MIYKNLEYLKNLISNSFQCEFSNLQIEKESAEYSACKFILNIENNKSISIGFRVAKITPKKVGQFVTLWKRFKNGPIQPYDLSDDIDFFIISVQKDNNLGYFIFPKTILHKYGVISKNNQGGKRAIRLYSPYDNTINEQAKKNQSWQVKYFINALENEFIDFHKLCLS